MDKELLDVLKEIQGDMKTVQGDMKTMQDDMKTMQGDIKTMQDDMKTMQGDIKTMQNDIKTIQDDMKAVKGELKEVNVRLDSVEGKTDKNSLMLENLNKKVEIIAEVQTSFREQLDRTTNKDGKTLSDRLNIIEMSVSDTSFRVKEVQCELARVVKITADNWTDIVRLKMVK